jgi:uncharacterized protein (TIGR00730 family)
MSETRFRRLCVFCGSNPGNDPRYARVAYDVGCILAGRGIGVVFGAGRVGMMGAVAQGALDAGGSVIGVIPDGLMIRELARDDLTELHVVRSMHERKQMMADLSDGFIALPGGFGTFEEFCEIVTWGQLGIHRKPCGLLSVNGYYEPLLRMFDHAVAEGFLRARHRQLVIAETDLARLLDAMARYEPEPGQVWLQRENA